MGTFPVLWEGFAPSSFFTVLLHFLNTVLLLEIALFIQKNVLLKYNYKSSRFLEIVG